MDRQTSEGSPQHHEGSLRLSLPFVDHSSLIYPSYCSCTPVLAIVTSILRLRKALRHSLDKKKAWLLRRMSQDWFRRNRAMQRMAHRLFCRCQQISWPKLSTFP